MPETFVYFTDIGRIETEVNMSRCEGWAGVAKCNSEEMKLTSSSSVKDGCTESNSVKESSVVAYTEQDDATKGFNPCMLGQYLKRKFPHQGDAIEFTQFSKKGKRRY